MKDWTIDNEGHRWTVQLDVRDLGGHLDATKRARAATCAKRAAAVLGKVPVVGALPLGFGGKLRILRTMHTPAALHGSEASHLSAASTRKLRTAYVGAVTSGSMPLANPGAVLSLLDGPLVVILDIILFGVHFGCFGGLWLIMLRFWIWFVSMVFFVLYLVVHLVMVPFTSCFRVPLILVLVGILLHVFGIVQVCPLLITLLVHFSILTLLA